MEDKKIIQNRYEVFEELGRGSLGRVFRAYDRALDREVALKTFSEIRNPPAIARIQKEASVWGRIKHPHIASLYDIFVDEDTVYFVVEYVDGGSLRLKIKSSPFGALPIEESLRYVSQIAEALIYLHESEIIHRDIKPSNILLRKKDDAAILTDFNTGRLVDRGGTITEGIIGTPAYMAPEQLYGNRATTAVDVYSLGIVLLEALLGGVPDNDRARMHVRDARPSVPIAAADLIQDLLNAKPDNRPTSSEAKSKLDDILSRENWNRVNSDDANFQRERKKVPAPSTARFEIDSRSSLFLESVSDGTAFTTQIQNSQSVRPTGYYANELHRIQAFSQSADFFRSHLGEDYDNLLKQARYAFNLWLACVGVGFVILAFGIALLFLGDTLQGAITITSNAFVIFIQRLFKQREEYYLSQAEAKQRHLELGNVWNMSIQTIDGIGNDDLREEKISQLLDALNERISV